MTEPAPMLPNLARILARHQAGMARSLQTAIGPSEIGDPCERALGYRLAQTPPAREEGLAWAPLVGTWGHAGVAEALSAANFDLGRERYLIERRVEITPADDILGAIAGTTDCFDRDASEVVDWKFVGKTSVERYCRKGPGQRYRTQAHLYGLGWRRAGFAVVSVRIVFLPRWSHRLDDGTEWAEPYEETLALAALERLRRVRLISAAAGVPALSADYSDCRFCPWHQPGIEAATDEGCPGHAEAQARRDAAFLDGLVA